MKRITPRLYIGDIEDAGDAAALEAEGITAVLKLTYAAPETPYSESVSVADHPLVDGPRSDFEAFRAAADRLTTLLGADESVLVHCSAGSSRSGAVAATARARLDGVDVDTALARIRDEKPDVDPHPALLEHARRVATGVGNGG